MRVRGDLLGAAAVGPASDTSPHVIGAQFDTGYKEDSYLLRTEISGKPRGWAGPAQGEFMELSFPEPGSSPSSTTTSGTPTTAPRHVRDHGVR
ncbi:cupredoxin domain-containing protein [Salinactinospora qingdaonensis]|uniref:Uncharacterized protein n=1 Tax=Salinactinospora qingdaonensis TaxID=702744 RepID=A0ABP7FTK7_9ACTN